MHHASGNLDSCASAGSIASHGIHRPVLYLDVVAQYSIVDGIRTRSRPAPVLGFAAQATKASIEGIASVALRPSYVAYLVDVAFPHQGRRLVHGRLRRKTDTVNQETLAATVACTDRGQTVMRTNRQSAFPSILQAFGALATHADAKSKSVCLRLLAACARLCSKSVSRFHGCVSSNLCWLRDETAQIFIAADYSRALPNEKRQYRHRDFLLWRFSDSPRTRYS